LVDGASRSRILEFLIKQEPRAFTIKQMSHRLGLPRQCVRATVEDLHRDHFVVRLYIEGAGFPPAWRAAGETDPWVSPRAKISGLRR
jgi:predicted ArsR family transcriptional regulator